MNFCLDLCIYMDNSLEVFLEKFSFTSTFFLLKMQKTTFLKIQPRKQQFSNPGVLNISVPIVKMWKLTFPAQYFNIFEMYNSI